MRGGEPEYIEYGLEKAEKALDLIIYKPLDRERTGPVISLVQGTPWRGNSLYQYRLAPSLQLVISEGCLGP